MSVFRKRKSVPIGWYDVRGGAAGYAPIIGTFGALSIPAIFLLFNNELARAESATLIVFAVGSLIVSLLGSMFGAIGLAAIAAEREPTANLSGAVMQLSVGISIGFVAMFAGIDTVAVHFVPEAGWLFALLVAITGVLCAFFAAAAIGDSSALGPPERSSGWTHPKWITSRSMGLSHTLKAFGVACVPILATGLFRSFNGAVTLTTIGVEIFVATSAGLVLLSLIGSVLRSVHRDDGLQSGLYPMEAYATTFLSGAYAAAVLVLLP